MRTPQEEERARAETDPVAADLCRLDPDNDLLTPGIVKGTLWLQTARYEIDRLLSAGRGRPRVKR